MPIIKLSLLRSFFESIDGFSKPFLEAAMDGLMAVLESEESEQAAASKAAEKIERMRQSADAKIAELDEKKKAVEENLAAAQA